MVGVNDEDAHAPYYSSRSCPTSAPGPTLRRASDRLGSIVLKNPEIRLFENEPEMPFRPDF
jgi:hypothetical protein